MNEFQSKNNFISKTEEAIKDVSCLYVSDFMLAFYGNRVAQIYAYLDSESKASKKRGELVEGKYFCKLHSDIAANCNTSVSTVKRSIAILESEGYIESRFFHESWVRAKYYWVNPSVLEEKSKGFDVESYFENRAEELAERSREANRRSRDKKRKSSGHDKKYQTYIMIDEYTRLIKLGRSVSPSERENTLCSQIPKIRLLFVLDRDIENKLHSEYKAKRHRGEWFKLSIEEVVKIADDYGFEAVY